MLTAQYSKSLTRAIENFRVQNPNKKKSEVVNHFLQEGFARQTIYDHINRLDNPQRKKKGRGRERPPTFTAAKQKKLKRLAKNRVGVSCRKLAPVLSTSKSTISYHLKKMSLSFRKRQKTPKYSDDQARRAKKLSRKLVKYLYQTKKLLILDDEKYFGLSCDEVPGNCGFYTDNIDECPDEVRFKPKEKYPVKVLVWVAFSERGVSEPLIRPHKSVAINQYIYLDQCLQQRLLPFIQQYHQDGNYLFWPDLASAHYATLCVNWMTQNIEFVGKDMNPPNVPQARSIENFWGDLVQKVYNNGWQAKTQHQLMLRIKKCLKEVTVPELHAHMAGMKNKLRKIAELGVLATFKKMNLNN